jgi:amidase
MKAVITQEPWLADPSLVPIPWRQPSFSGVGFSTGRHEFTVGVSRDDGFVMPHPPVLRAINELVSSLESAKASDIDITVVDVPPFEHDNSWLLSSRIYFVFLLDMLDSLLEGWVVVGEEAEFCDFRK